MRCLVVHAHPDPGSYNAALRERAVAGLERAGHHVDVIDLYAVGFQPCLTEAELTDYETVGLDHPDPMVAHHIDLISRADALIFVYPTWWSGLPAVLKGWLDRVLLPGVAFELSPGPGGATKVAPKLTSIRTIVGITTYGSKRRDVALLGDAGRRTLTRTVRLVCSRRCRTTWLALHQLDVAPDEARRRFLDEVEDRMARL